MELLQPISRRAASKSSHAASTAAWLVIACVLLMPHHGVAARRLMEGADPAGGVNGDVAVLSALAAHPAEGSTFSVESVPTTPGASEYDTLSALDGVHAAATPAPTPALPPPPPFLDGTQPAPLPAQVKGDSLNCSGFAQPRTYIEGQAWFTPDSLNPDAVNDQSMHLHVGACVPHRQWVAGVVKLAILVQRHGYNMPDNTPVTLKAEIEQTTSTGTMVRMTTFGKIADDAWDCSTATDLARLCKRVFYMDVQTSTWNGTAAEGLNILRLVGLTAMNDTKQARTVETRIVSNIVLWNNRAVKPVYPTGLSKTLPPSQLSTTGHPWQYTHAEYLNEIPMAPIKGNLTFKASFFSQTNTANVTGVFIAIDPVFHTQPVAFGQVLRSYGPQSPTPAAIPNAECPVVFNGNVSHIDCRNMATLTYNTSNLADNKWHKIFLRVDSFVSSNDPIITTRSSKIGGGTFSAVTLLAFRVNNTGKTISDPVPANATAGLYIRPPSDFTPPEGVVVFTGNQSLPSTNTTLNIAASNYNCTGDSATWLEPRVYLEGGSMFARPGQNLDYGNNSALLVGACLPHGQRVAGKVPVDILLQKRNFPAESGLDVLIRLQLDWAWGNITYRLSQAEKRTNWTCATPGNCRSIISIQVDTKPADGKYVAPDGPQAVTVEAETKFNWGASSKTMISRVHSWLFLTNNKDTNVSIPTNTSGSAKLEYPFGNGNHWTNFTRPVPLLTPVIGSTPISFVVSSPVNITNMVLAVNPVWGPISDRGMVLATGSRITGNKTLCPGNNNCKLTNTPLDSTKLCNGVHRLVLRSDSYVAPQPAGTPLEMYGTGTWASYHMAPFTVANPTQAVNCIKTAAAASVKAASVRSHLGATAAARNRLYRAYRLSPERVIMAAAPRALQDLEVESYNNPAADTP